MFYLRVSLTILLTMLLGCGGPSESERPEGILVSWLAEANKSNPCVVVANKANADRLLSIGRQDYGCIGRQKIIAHYPSDAGLAHILSAIPASPELVDSNSDIYPWHVIRLNAKDFDAFRLNDDEAQVLFKAIAEDSPPQLREEIYGRLIHATSPDEAGKEYQVN